MKTIKLMFSALIMTTLIYASDNQSNPIQVIGQSDYSGLTGTYGQDQNKEGIPTIIFDIKIDSKKILKTTPSANQIIIGPISNVKESNGILVATTLDKKSSFYANPLNNGSNLSSIIYGFEEYAGSIGSYDSAKKTMTFKDEKSPKNTITIKNVYPMYGMNNYPANSTEVAHSDYKWYLMFPGNNIVSK